MKPTTPKTSGCCATPAADAQARQSPHHHADPEKAGGACHTGADAATQAQPASCCASSAADQQTAHSAQHHADPHKAGDACHTDAHTATQTQSASCCAHSTAEPQAAHSHHHPADPGKAGGTCHAGTHATEHSHPAATAGSAGAGALRDPVCGMSVAPDSPHRAGHGGQEYRFCSAGCRDRALSGMSGG